MLEFDYNPNETMDDLRSIVKDLKKEISLLEKSTQEKEESLYWKEIQISDLLRDLHFWQERYESKCSHCIEIDENKSLKKLLGLD